MNSRSQTPMLWALWLVAFLIPLSPEVGATGLRPEDLLILALGGLLALDVAVQDNCLQITGARFFIILVVLWLLGVISSSIGAVLGTVEILSLSPTESATLTIVKEAELLVLFLLSVRYVRSKEAAHTLVSTLCFGSAVLASLVVIELIALHRGALVSPLQYHLMGELFGFAASLAAGRLFFGDVQGRERLFFIVILTVTIIGVFISGEAGALMGLAVAVGMLTTVALDRPSPHVSGRLLILAGGIILLVVGAALLAVPEFGRTAVRQFEDILGILSGDLGRSTRIRFKNWGRRIPEVLSRRPLLGFGQIAIPPSGLDNEYLQRLYYTGIIGFSFYLYLLLTATRTVFAAADRDETGFVAGYAGVIGIMLGAGLAKGVLHSANTSMFFVLCSALVYVLLDRDDFMTNH